MTPAIFAVQTSDAGFTETTPDRHRSARAALESVLNQALADGARRGDGLGRVSVAMLGESGEVWQDSYGNRIEAHYSPGRGIHYATRFEPGCQGCVIEEDRGAASTIADAAGLLRILVKGPGGSNEPAYTNALALAHHWLAEHDRH